MPRTQAEAGRLHERPHAARVLGTLGSWLKNLGTRFQQLLRKPTPVTRETLLKLREIAAVMPEGPLQVFFTAVSKAIDTMNEDALGQIREERVPHGTAILRQGRENRDLCLLLEGNGAIHIADETLPRPAPEVLGEMSLLLTKGKPTADVTSLGDSLIVRIPTELFQSILVATPAAREAIDAIMQERIAQTRSLGALNATGLNPAQLVAQIAMLKLHEEGAKASLLGSAESLARVGKENFAIQDIPAGTPFIRQGESLKHVMLILEGSANKFINGGCVDVATPGDFVGADDVFASPSATSRFEYSAIKNMRVLTIDSKAFLSLRSTMERIVIAERKTLLERARKTPEKSVALEEVPTEVIDRNIHIRATHSRMFIPLEPSGGEGTFECGKDAQVLCWLGVRGRLWYDGKSGWQIIKEAPEGSVLKRAADAPVFVPREILIQENLRPAVRGSHVQDTNDALRLYGRSGLNYEQARFLVERGFVARREPNETFGKSFPHIQEALSYIESWAQKTGASREHRMLGDMLPVLLMDTTHQIGITALMKDPAMRDMVLDCLDTMLTLPPADRDQYESFMKQETDSLKSRHHHDTIRWNGIGTTRRMTAFKQRLLEHPDFGELFRLSPASTITPKQSQQLQKYVQMLDTEVCPALVRHLEAVLEKMSPREDGMRSVTGRTKTASGIIDKMRRVQLGNRGKKPRDNFTLADLPDAVGARVIVQNVEELEVAMALIEGEFQGRIYEKDDCYGNPEKLHHPFRLVTYTVECNGVPSEIQLQTLPSALAAAIDHDIIYKPYVPASLGERNLAMELQRRVTMMETKERLRGSTRPGTQEESTTNLQQPPMRHIFQSASSSGRGRCVCAFVSEESAEWKNELAEARGYFQWRESKEYHTTIHHGSSSIDCSSCIGVPSWQQFRAETLRQRTDALETLHDGAHSHGVIDALDQEGVPLFVLEELGKDLDVDANLEAFRQSTASRFTQEECSRTEQALAIAQRAHGSQSYALEKQKDGRPVYPSSLELRHIPYWNHSMQVARLVVDCGLSADAVQAALLHDVLEDTTVTESGLQPTVSERALALIRNVTRTKAESREQYMERVRALTGEAKVLKALDRYHNLLRAFNLRDGQQYLDRIIGESKDIFAGDFEPNAALSALALRFQMLLEAVEQLRLRKFGSKIGE